MQTQLNIPFAQYIPLNMQYPCACCHAWHAPSTHAQHKDKKSIAHKCFACAPLEKCWEAKPAWKQNMQEPLLTYQGPWGMLISQLYWTFTHRFGSFFTGCVQKQIGKDVPISVCSCSCMRGQTQPGATIIVPFVYIVLVNVHTLCIHVL